MISNTLKMIIKTKHHIPIIYDLTTYCITIFIKFMKRNFTGGGGGARWQDLHNFLFLC